MTEQLRPVDGRLGIHFGPPTQAAIARATFINPKTGLPECRNPVPRWFGHGQQRAGKHLAEPGPASPPLSDRDLAKKVTKAAATKARRAVRAAALKAFRVARGKRNLSLTGPRASVLTPKHKRQVKGFDFTKVDTRKFLNSGPAKRAWCWEAFA